MADDYALTAKWAVDSGADCIETNFSCPNVASCDGQLYQQPEDAGLIAERVRNAIGHTPLLIKIGHFREIANNEELATALLSAIAPFVDGVATTNSIAATVADQSGQLLFDGQRRGICGDAIRAESIRQTKTLCQIIHDRKLKISVVGIGGIQSAAHVESYINAGAESVQLATAAMLNPLVGIEIRRSLASQM